MVKRAVQTSGWWKLPVKLNTADRECNAERADGPDVKHPVDAKYITQINRKGANILEWNAPGPIRPQPFIRCGKIAESAKKRKAAHPEEVFMRKL